MSKNTFEEDTSICLYPNHGLFACSTGIDTSTCCCTAEEEDRKIMERTECRGKDEVRTGSSVCCSSLDNAFSSVLCSIKSILLESLASETE